MLMVIIGDSNKGNEGKCAKRGEIQHTNSRKLGLKGLGRVGPDCRQVRVRFSVRRVA